MRGSLSLLALGGALALAACSDGATGPEASGLTRAEAARLAAVVGLSGSDAVSAQSSSSASRSTSAAEPSFTWSFDNAAPCPLGGKVGVKGEAKLSASSDTRSGTVEIDAAMKHQGCRVRLEERTVTLDGDPDVRLATGFAWSGGAPTEPLRVTQKGSLKWSAEGGASGTCGIDLTAVTDFAARQRTVSGTFCGFEVDEKLSWN